MRALLQRVRRASVEVDGEVVGSTGPGFLILLGVRGGDGEDEAQWLADKIVGLRAFRDGDGKMNLSLPEVNGSALVVSQFTLYGDCRKGRRPSFIESAPPGVAEPLYERFVELLREKGVPAETGRFGAAMQVSLVNDGPVTLIIDSPE